MTEVELMAQATAAAVVRTAMASGIELPERLAAACAAMAHATDQRVVKVSAGMTAARYAPDGPLPKGVDLHDWHNWRLFDIKPYRATAATMALMPAKRVLPPEPCYVVHVSDNGISAESWFKDHGFAAFSEAPFRCTLREIAT